MMSPEDISAAAAALVKAETTGRQIGILSERHPDLSMDQAYEIQGEVIAQKIAAGRRVIGWKIGLTSKAMQAALSIDTPDSGVLLDDMAFDSGATVPKGRFIQPRIEAEIAFLMARDLDPAEISPEGVLAATEATAPSLEILDTRIIRLNAETGVIRKVTDTISDNAANAGIVLGAARHRPGEVDLRRVGAIVKRDGEVEETGLGAGVLDDPVTSMVWLAERLAQYGQRIEAGQVVLSGSFIRPVECPPGSRIEADFGDFGEVSVSFA